MSAELTAKTHSKTAQKILRAQKQPAAPTLFIGNLGFEATEESIRGLFEAHRAVKKKVEDGDEGGGESEEKKDKLKDVWIRKVRMGTFEDTGLCKGYATYSIIQPIPTQFPLQVRIRGLFDYRIRNRGPDKP